MASNASLAKIALASIFFTLSAACVSADQEFLVAERGVLDLRFCDFDECGPVPISGEWAFYRDTLIDEGNFRQITESKPDFYAEVPGYWDDLEVDGSPIGPYGMGTYVMTIVIDPEIQSELALKFLNITPNSAIYVDGVRRIENGVVSADREVSESGNRPCVLPLGSRTDSIVLAVGVSNFHNVNGGMNRPVYFGAFEDLIGARERILVADSIFLGGLFLMGLYQSAIFLLDRRRKASVYMAALCFLAMFFSGFKNEMAFLGIFPGWDGEIRSKIIYLSLSLSPAAFSLYTENLYPMYFKKHFGRIIVPLSLSAALIVIVTPMVFHSRLTLLLEVLVLGAAAYNLSVLVLAYLRTREGRILAYLVGLVFLLLSIGFGILDNEVASFFQSVAGMFFVFVLYQAFLQAYVFSNAFQEIDNLSFEKTKLEKRNVELFSLSYIDSLTGVCNRRLMDDFLASNWRVNSFSDRPLGLILVDIDHLKFFNDYYGHRKGDLCIKEVCELIRLGMGDDDKNTLARYGGDEFAVITSDSDELNLFRLAEKIRSGVESGAIEHAASAAGVVTVSVGCASMVPDIEEAPEVLLDAADRALNNAKVKGRNRTEVDCFSEDPFLWGPRLTD